MSNNVIILNNHKFQTARLGCFFRLPLTIENLSFATLLSLYQSNVSKRYKTMYEVDHRLAELYDLDISVLPMIRGNQILFNFETSFVEPNLILDETYNYPVLVDEFFSFLLEPLWEQSGEKILQQTKDELFDEIDEYFDSPDNIAYFEFFKSLYRDNPDYGVSVFGNKEIIEQINLSQLEDFYHQLIKQPTVIIGQVQGKEEIERLINPYLSKLPGLREDFDVKTLNVPLPSLRDEVVERQFSANQTQLFLGYGWEQKLDINHAFVPNILAMYLGGDEYSILFQKIREQYGAVYSIDALNYNNNHLLVIAAGIQKDKLDVVQAEIKQIMIDLANGKIDEDVFNKAKQALLRRRLMGQDQQKFGIQTELMNKLRKQPRSFEEVNALAEQIEPEDLIDLAKQLVLMESYLLD